jgi:ABC-2 type transport system ATP-binding protein
LIRALGVSRRFGRRVALHPTDFALDPGELVALVGPNGAGKSTLLALLAGALEPSTGNVVRDVETGWAPQRPAMYGKLTPAENIVFFARLGGFAGTHVDLPELPAAELSAGQRQRLNLELAFLGSPRALLLDEPTGALDEERRTELWARVDELRRGGGGIVFATQHADEAARADRLLRLHDGRAQ